MWKYLNKEVCEHVSEHSYCYVMWLSEFVSFLVWPYLCASKRMSMLPFQWVQSFSQVWLCDPMDHSMPGFPVHLQLPELAQTHVHRVSDAIQPSYPLSSPSSSCLQSFQHQERCWKLILSNELVLHIMWPKYWSFSFSISPSNEYSELVFFSTDWFDVLAAQGALKSLPQHHSLKTSVLQCSPFFYGPTLTSIHDCWKNRSFD